MTRCKSCLMKAEPLNGHCPVCGIVQDKKTGDLSPTEKKVRFHARGIRLVAMLHLIGAAIAVFIMPEFAGAFAITIVALLNTILAYGLVRYSHIAYKAATASYFCVGMIGVITIQLFLILVTLVALYLIGNGTSKAIFERLLPETV